MLDPMIWSALARGGAPADAAIEVPGHEGRFRCRVCAVPPADGFHADGEAAIAVALAEERSDLGAGLVEALWFDRPVALWVPPADGGACLRVEARVWRCHIAGALFSDVLARVRAADAAADIASAWELRATAAERVPGGMPAAVEPSRAPRAELHLDRLLR